MGHGICGGAVSADGGGAAREGAAGFVGLAVGAAAGGGDKTGAAIAAIGECGAEELDSSGEGGDDTDSLDSAGEGGDNAPDSSSFPSWLLLPSLLPLLLSLRLRLRLRL